MHKYFALTAWMLLAIFGLGLPPQQQVQPVAGVLTLNLVPGTSSFKVILSANVTSVVIVNPTPGTIISVIFTENATGGFTVAFGGNIANPCSVTTTANATTICQFQYDATSNTWTGIGVGGGVATGGVYATQLALNAGQTLFMDTNDGGGNGCSLAGSPAVVTCTSNTFNCPTATTGDFGKIIWAVNTATPGALALGDSTITTCTDAKHVTASTNTLISGAVSNLRFGHDDTAAWDAINSAYNTLLNTQGACLLIPAGMTTVKHATLVVNPTSGYNGSGPFAPCWRSLGITYFSPVPDFVWNFFTAGSNIEFLGWGVGSCCKSGGPEQSYAENIVIDGAGLNSGTGTCAVGAGMQGTFMSQMHSRHVGIVGWCEGVSGFTPVSLDNLGNHYDILNVGAGSVGLNITGGSNPNAPTNLYGGQVTCSQAATVFGATIIGSLNSHNVEFSCAKTAVNFAPSPTTQVWHSEHDAFNQPSGQTRPLIDVQGGTAWFSDCWAASSTGNQILRTNGAGTVHFKGCTFNAASTQFWADTHTVAGGTCYDDGGNNIIGSFASDCIPTGRNGIWGVGTGVGTAATTLFLVPPASTTTLFTNTTATTSSGVAPFTGTLANLVCTSTAAGVNASSGAVTVRLAPLSTGTFAASTLTATFGTTTSAKDQTHTVAVTQGQPIQFQITTQTAETLAGVQCRVSEY